MSTLSTAQLKKCTKRQLGHSHKPRCSFALLREKDIRDFRALFMHIAGPELVWSFLGGLNLLVGIRFLGDFLLANLWD